MVKMQSHLHTSVNNLRSQDGHNKLIKKQQIQLWFDATFGAKLVSCWTF